MSIDKAADENDSIVDLVKGSRVWYKQDQNIWVAGELKSAPSSSCTVALDNGSSIVVQAGKLQPANPKLQDGIPDLTQISYLNEPSILYNLQLRYMQQDIYTWAGPVLVALNPCKLLPLYTTEMANIYKRAAKDYVTDLSPHIYLVAATAYRQMVRDNRSQSLVVSGESGAGKTETTKKAMQYFATLAGGTGIEDQVLETNPILESFGNAKTLRNHNSSRFGKLLEINFNQSNHICGARIRTYLLEKSRVVNQLKGERSYHIFYQLIRGVSPEVRKMYRLPDRVEVFNYLNQSGCVDIDGVDDAADFKEVVKSLLDVGIQEDWQEQMFRTVAGVLWLGNLEFGANHDDSAYAKRTPALTNAAELLGVSEDVLSRSLTSRKIHTRNEVITKFLNLEDAYGCRDALAKATYAALFNWIVERINDKLSAKDRASSGRCIAILDIYGFEHFEKNSFEQLCINYANERLQQQFNQHLFTLEQQEYSREEIDFTQVQFTDNQDVLDVIEAMPPKGLGVIAVLESQCKFPRATDETFLHNLKTSLKSSTLFGINPRCPDDFTIKHYAGVVQYHAPGFLDKNKDTINGDLVEMMSTSSCQLLLALCIELSGDSGGGRLGQTVSSRFMSQLRELINLLNTTGLHFVRCVKPNPGLKPDMFTTDMVLQQLRCSGVLEVTRIARAGFPTRYTHEVFVDRYQVLLPRTQLQSGELGGLSPGQGCQMLIDFFKIEQGQYQLGKTKIFFRPGVLGFVEDTWARVQSAALVLQASGRMWVLRGKYLRMRAATLWWQSAWRAIPARLDYKQLKCENQAAKCIQRAWSTYITHVRYVQLRCAVRTLQAGYRMWKLTERVTERVRIREQAELEARLAAEEKRRQEESFEAMKSEFGISSLAEIKAALDAYINGSVAPMNQAVIEAAAERLAAERLAAQRLELEKEMELVRSRAEELRREAEERREEEERREAERREERTREEERREAERREAEKREEERREEERREEERIEAQRREEEEREVEGRREEEEDREVVGELAMTGVGEEVGLGSRAQVEVAEVGVQTDPMEETKSQEKEVTSNGPVVEPAALLSNNSSLQLRMLEMENMKLKKQVQMEKALREKLAAKMEEQAQEWVEQVRMSQNYLQHVKAHMEGRGPPLPPMLDSPVPSISSPPIPAGSSSPLPGHHSIDTSRSASLDASGMNEHRLSARTHSHSNGNGVCWGSQGQADPATPRSMDSFPMPDPEYSGVHQLQNEFHHVGSIMLDDATFIQEVREGLVDADGMDTREELNKLKAKFKVWKKDFEVKLANTDDALKKMERMERKVGRAGTRPWSPPYTTSPPEHARAADVYAGLITSDPVKKKGLLRRITHSFKPRTPP